MIIKGEVQSGVGRGSKFIALPIYENIFRSELGKKPYYGTLNLKLSDNDASIINDHFQEGEKYDNLTYQGKEYGGIIVIPVTIICGNKNISAVGVRPLLTSHDSKIIELVSHEHLRECLNLQDGDTVSFEITNSK